MRWREHSGVGLGRDGGELGHVKFEVHISYPRWRGGVGNWMKRSEVGWGYKFASHQYLDLKARILNNSPKVIYIDRK